MADYKVDTVLRAGMLPFRTCRSSYNSFAAFGYFLPPIWSWFVYICYTFTCTSVSIPVSHSVYFTQRLTYSLEYKTQEGRNLSHSLQWVVAAQINTWHKVRFLRNVCWMTSWWSGFIRSMYCFSYSYCYSPVLWWPVRLWAGWLPSGT